MDPRGVSGEVDLKELLAEIENEEELDEINDRIIVLEEDPNQYRYPSYLYTHRTVYEPEKGRAIV